MPGYLFDQLEYLADTETAVSILNGLFQPLPEMDGATVVLLEEIGHIGQHLCNREVKLTITTEEFQEYWKKMKEKTSLSFSGLHFGHYKAISTSDDLSAIFARKISLVARTGLPPERWGLGLSVIC